jgi:hypothetical protein
MVKNDGFFAQREKGLLDGCEGKGLLEEKTKSGEERECVNGGA